MELTEQPRDVASHWKQWQNQSAVTVCCGFNPGVIMQYDYMPMCYRLELRDWLDTVEREPDAISKSSQCNDSTVAEKPRPATLAGITKHCHKARTPTEV